MTAHEVFRSTFGTDDDGTIRGNLMTPDVLSRRFVGPYAVELSTGSGFEPGSRIFGVTVLLRSGERTELSGCYPTREEAETYIDALEDARTAWEIDAEECFNNGGGWDR